MLIKRSFTLVEITIVILIMGMIYMFVPINFFKDHQIKVDTSTFKEDLYAIGYENNVSLKCVYDLDKCFIFIDDEYHKEIKNPFGIITDVYTYEKNYKSIRFSDIKIDDSYYRLSLNFEMNYAKAHQDILIQTKDKVYLIQSIDPAIKEFDSIAQVIEKNQMMIQEVRNAF